MSKNKTETEKEMLIRLGAEKFIAECNYDWNTINERLDRIKIAASLSAEEYFRMKIIIKSIYYDSQNNKTQANENNQ